MAWELVILNSGARFPLEVGKEYVVGSGSSAHIKLTARDVSGTHALITVFPNGVRVVDLGSKNGTFHKGKRVAVVELGSGDTVTFSSIRAQFFLGDRQASVEEPRTFVEKEPSQTGEFPVAALDGDLPELIRSWDLNPERAPHALLAWLVARRRLAAGALLQVHGEEVVVLTAQGPLPPNLASSTTLLPVLRDLSQRPWDVLEIPGSNPPAFVCPLGYDRSLLLLTGSTRLSSLELELAARLARLAFRLSGV